MLIMLNIRYVKLNVLEIMAELVVFIKIFRNGFFVKMGGGAVAPG